MLSGKLITFISRSDNKFIDISSNNFLFFYFFTVQVPFEIMNVADYTLKLQGEAHHCQSTCQYKI